MLTLDGNNGFSTTVKEFEVAGLFVAQDSDAVITQLITSLFARVDVV